ncbi:MAG: fumarylacetoacetate hydrolase family protein [Nocardioides sp.]|uniref:fumarylacetoacetate hydrolase family protein n=1 Tax=Nocardioides sp. TaxID=35761 RepID=UPI0039E3DB42
MTELWALPRPSLAVVGSDDRFPVRRIYCVGRNYVDHIREMKEGDERDLPFFFQKPTDSLVESGDAVPYPPQTADLQYEGELVAAIGAPGADVSLSDATSIVFGYAAGIDLTRRDLQRDAVRASRPWEMGKSFDHSAPCGPITPAAGVPGIAAGELELTLNGERRQATRLDLMIWKVPEIIHHLSRQYRLEPGDLIYTGTPAGVGPVRAGDSIVVSITGLAPLEVTVR